jgi:transcriptional regulator with XRE-family HTH domain
MPGKSANAIDRFVSEKVRARRKEIGMTQQALASTVGVTFQQLQKYEKGTNRISAGRLLAIARGLKMPVARFFDGAPEDP